MKFGFLINKIFLIVKKKFKVAWNNVELILDRKIILLVLQYLTKGVIEGFYDRPLVRQF